MDLESEDDIWKVTIKAGVFTMPQCSELNCTWYCRHSPQATDANSLSAKGG